MLKTSFHLIEYFPEHHGGQSPDPTVGHLNWPQVFIAVLVVVIIINHCFKKNVSPYPGEQCPVNKTLSLKNNNNNNKKTRGLCSKHLKLNIFKSFLVTVLLRSSSTLMEFLNSQTPDRCIHTHTHTQSHIHTYHLCRLGELPCFRVLNFRTWISRSRVLEFVLLVMLTVILF